MKNGKAAEKVLIRFQNGIYGFEETNDFILLQEDENKVIWRLQAAACPYPSLLVVDPFLILPDYCPSLTDEQKKSLGDPEPRDLCYLSVAVIRKDPADSVVNLKSPIVINAKKRVGIQIILEESGYPVQYRLFRQQAGRGLGQCL